MSYSFDEPPTRKDFRRQDPWPIKLAKRYGAKSDRQAYTALIILSTILLTITATLYWRLFFAEKGTDYLENLPPETIQKLRNRGIEL